jgi:hypothetical protein
MIPPYDPQGKPLGDMQWRHRIDLKIAIQNFRDQFA